MQTTIKTYRRNIIIQKSNVFIVNPRITLNKVSEKQKTEEKSKSTFVEIVKDTLQMMKDFIGCVYLPRL